MGEMTIRLDDAVLLALRERADSLGTAVERLAEDLIRTAIAKTSADRLAVADAIRARTRSSPISSVTLLDQIRDEGP